MTDRNRHFPDAPGDDEGYDDSQRAEILEATRDGPSDGTILTDLVPDLGDEAEVDDEDDDAIENLSVIDTDGASEDGGSADGDA
ncbi:hypothetical protein ACLB0R_02865 [Sphingomonas sp. GlSt437]|uniref:hypothetical protein n=1 Tax=Sphingomonas sp. GlSt437 TaxID=3389970 RepID=UPI003A8517DB